MKPGLKQIIITFRLNLDLVISWCVFTLMGSLFFGTSYIYFLSPFRV